MNIYIIQVLPFVKVPTFWAGAKIAQQDELWIACEYLPL